MGNTTIVFLLKLFFIESFLWRSVEVFLLLKICFIGRFFIESVLLRSVEVDSGG